jgi:hypothetical protein
MIRLADPPPHPGGDLASLLEHLPLEIAHDVLQLIDRIDRIERLLIRLREWEDRIFAAFRRYCGPA